MAELEVPAPAALGSVPKSEPSAGRSDNIQALRALAAWAVVGHHLVDSLNNYLAPTRFSLNPAVGSYGVEIFFVISGYVMMLGTARRQPAAWRFLVERFVRISPPYWLLTIATFILLRSGLHAFSHKPASIERLLASLFYLPYFAGAKPEKPILFPGWTLNYEMMFYALFAACLLLGSERRRITAMTGTIVIAVLAQCAFDNALTDYLGRDIVVGFAFGVLLWPLTRRLEIAVPSATAACLAGLALLVVCDIPALRGWAHVELPVSLGAWLLVGGAVFLEKRSRAIRSRWILFQGDSSYALYLVHPFAIQALGKASVVTGLNRTLPGILLTLVLMIVAAAALAATMHLAFERPVHRYARQLLG